MQLPGKPEEGLRVPGARITDGCELHVTGSGI